MWAEDGNWSCSVWCYDTRVDIERYAWDFYPRAQNSIGLAGSVTPNPQVSGFFFNKILENSPGASMVKEGPYVFPLLSTKNLPIASSGVPKPWRFRRLSKSTHTLGSLPYWRSRYVDKPGEYTRICRAIVPRLHCRCGCVRCHAIYNGEFQGCSNEYKDGCWHRECVASKRTSKKR